MTGVKILAFSGSSRANSFNQTLVSVAHEAAQEAGADVTLINLGDYPLPIFNEDLEREQGHPAEVNTLKTLFKDHHGFLISSPEYNSSISALLKNVIDWVSRPTEGELPLEPYQNKVAGLMAASPGGLGGLRGLVHLRSILQNIGVTVVPKQMAIPKAHEAFDSDGKLVDDFQRSQIKAIAEGVVKHAAALR